MNWLIIIWVTVGFVVGFFAYGFFVFKLGETENYINQEWVKKETPIGKTYQELFKKTGIDLYTEEGIEAAKRFLSNTNV